MMNFSRTETLSTLYMNGFNRIMIVMKDVMKDVYNEG